MRRLTDENDPALRPLADLVAAEQRFEAPQGSRARVWRRLTVPERRWSYTRLLRPALVGVLLVGAIAGASPAGRRFVVRVLTRATSATKPAPAPVVPRAKARVSSSVGPVAVTAPEPVTAPAAPSPGAPEVGAPVARAPVAAPAPTASPRASRPVPAAMPEPEAANPPAPIAAPASAPATPTPALPPAASQPVALAASPYASPHAALVLDAMQALRQRRQPAAADVLLQRYLALHPSGALAEEAYALRVEVAVAQHERRAATLAEEYLARWPRGRFAASARSALKRFGGSGDREQ
jgi:hypothetical protein